ncbi:hypothetical protein EON81_24835 [bacterium]|nr:MAG: hypothetical protein EON81_24835 [bacterium]
MKNGLKTADELLFDERWEGMNTALTAQDEANYRPRRYDVNETHTVPISAAFLPGSAIAFKIVFEVPKGTEPKDLVFTAMRFDMCTPGNQKKDPPQNIRVALKSDAE